MRYGLVLAIALLGLAGCGRSDVGGPSAPPGPPPSKLFVADAANRALGSLIDPNPAPGTFTVDRIVAGPDTGLGAAGGMTSITLDAAGDRLYVATQNSTLVFDQIGTAEGNVPRSRAIQSVVNNHTVNFFGLNIAPNDALYAVEPTGEVRVFNNASTLDGIVVPARTITPNTGSTINSTFGVTVDFLRHVLYVGVVATSSGIVVFNNVDSASGTLAPDRTLNFAVGVGSFCLDEGRDILYVAQSDGVILAFDNASMVATGTPTPNRKMTLPVPTTTSPSKQLFVTVDATSNRLYAVNGATGFIVSGASVADDAMLGATQITASSASSLFSAVAVAP